MTWPFEIGRAYNRREDIHARYGGQQQGGIITPANHPLVIVITGDSGVAHGYADQHRPDGVFEYFGEGQAGDMQLTKGNAAVANHSRDGEGLLLFRKTRRNGSLVFEGEVVCVGLQERQAPDSSGTMRRAFVFELRPLAAIETRVEDMSASSEPMSILRARAFEAAAGIVGMGRSTRTVYDRSRDVRDYVLARAGDTCEGCNEAAPFKRPDGRPYLEPHHTRRLSDGGPDHPAHVIALCPNCHRRVHAGADGSTYNEALMQSLRRIEPTG